MALAPTQGTGVRTSGSVNGKGTSEGRGSGESASNQVGQWTFVTNHTRVLLVIARDPTVRLRDIAATLDITERAAQRIVTELVEAGYLTREREGRRNTYEVHPDQSMRVPQASETSIGELIDLLLSNQDPLGQSS